MKVLNKKGATILILVCCFAYSMAYVGRYCYGANLTAVIADLQLSKSVGGSISSFFFFSYAGGQLLNAWLAKYYKPRVVVPTALTVSALCNLLMGLAGSAAMMQVVWLVNGIFQSTIWCCVLNIQAKHLAGRDIGRAIVWNSATVAIGTLLSYGVSALYAAIGLSWRAVFYTAAALVFSGTLVWLFGVGAALRPGFLTQEAEETAPAQKDAASAKTSTVPRLFTKPTVLVFSFTALAAVLCVFIRDGIVTWLPTILFEDFGLAGSLSILLTMILPELSLASAMLVQTLLKKIRGNLLLEGLFFAVSTAMLALVLVFYPLKTVVLTIALFALMYLAITSIVNITVSVIPFAMRKYSGAVGGISALLDAFCYLGSIFSTYLLGLLAEHTSWSVVITVTAAVSAAGLVAALLGAYFAKKNEITKQVF